MKFLVEVEITSRRTKELTIFAADENAAMEKAEDIVSQWDGVDEAEAISAEEEE